MNEADRLLLTGRTGILLAVERADLERLMGFGADGVECEDGDDEEPNDCAPLF